VLVEIEINNSEVWIFENSSVPRQTMNERGDGRGEVNALFYSK
jgi:hypothetical protein